VLNQEMTVAGLREGCMFTFTDGKIGYIGPRPLRIFKSGVEPYEVQPGDDFSFLMQ
jgi:dipeptidase E